MCDEKDLIVSDWVLFLWQEILAFSRNMTIYGEYLFVKL